MARARRSVSRAVAQGKLASLQAQYSDALNEVALAKRSEEAAKIDAQRAHTDRAQLAQRTSALQENLDELRDSAQARRARAACRVLFVGGGGGGVPAHSHSASAQCERGRLPRRALGVNVVWGLVFPARSERERGLA